MSKRLVLLFPVLFLAACGGDDEGEDTRPALTCDTNRTALRLVVNGLGLPAVPTNFAADQDGDGFAENHFGSITQGLLQQGVNQNEPVQDLVTRGVAPLLVEVQSSDASFTLDGCPLLTLRNAVATSANPDFSATPAFTVDAAATSFAITQGLIGERVDHRYESPGFENGAFTLRMFFGDGLHDIPLVNVSVGGLVTVDGITSGRLSGSIPASAIEESLGIPLARGVQFFLANPPSPFVPPLILDQFDDGGVADPTCGTACRNPDDGTCAAADDQIVSICEVLTDTSIAELLLPDVHVLADDSVTLAPDAANPAKNAMSFGIGFTAVTATY